MNKLNFVKGLLILTCLSFFYSCEKSTQDSLIINETPEMNSTALKNVKLKNDILVFIDQNHFKEVLEELKENEYLVTENLKTQMDFTSLKEIIDEDQNRLERGEQTQLKEDDYFTKDPLVAYPLMDYPFYTKSALLNKDGAVFLGDQLIKFDREFVYTILNGESTLLPEVGRFNRAGFHGDEVYASKIKSVVPDTGEAGLRKKLKAHCIQFNDLQDRFMRSAIVYNAYAILNAGAFDNYLEVEIKIQKFEKASSVALFQPYKCGGAQIQELTDGNDEDREPTEYLWRNTSKILTYDSQTQTNNSATHIFSILSEGPFWNTNDHSETLFAFKGYHPTRARFLDDCTNSNSSVENLNCTIFYDILK